MKTATNRPNTTNEERNGVLYIEVRPLSHASSMCCGVISIPSLLDYKRIDVRESVYRLSLALTKQTTVAIHKGLSRCLPLITPRRELTLPVRTPLLIKRNLLLTEPAFNALPEMASTLFAYYAAHSDGGPSLVLGQPNPH